MSDWRKILPSSKSAQFLELFCTDRFVQRVTDAGLHGFLFPQIWPPLEGRTFNEECTRLQRAAEKWKPRVGPELDIAGNSVVIRLYHDRKRASKQELATAGQLAEELEKTLYNENQLAAESYFGSVERTEECDFEVRVYLTGPDCDRLVTHLLPLLKGLPWPGKYHVVKKRSEHMVQNAPEEYVRLD